MTTTEKHQFQAEIQQLLDIVIHSLYTDKEIFVRELISNAADACEKLRFHQSSSEEVFDAEKPLSIAIQTDETAQTISFTDTGLGMTRDEMVQNLGTIAHSGSKTFLKQLAEDKRKETSLIGQFGVGFYSAFMVATQVTVFSRSYKTGEQGHKWTSDGVGGYEIEPVADLPRGTKIVVALKESEKEFAEDFTIAGIIKRYSNFVQFPITLNDKNINTVRAIWARNKNEIKEEEYNEFYQFVGHDHENPLYRLHFSADAPLAIQALLFVPGKNLESLGMARSESEVNLYCRKVLIQSKAKNLFPEWLRFLKGVVDSEDLPLNISRETMQDTSLIQKLNKVLTTRFLKFLDEQSEKDADSYNKFYDEYSKFIKEGAVSDYTHREALSKLLRFETSTLDKGQKTSLGDYVKRMGSEQKEIYYILAPNRQSAENSPYFEVFHNRKLEVLFLSDPWDEFVMDHLREFDGKKLVAAEKADVHLEKPEETETLSAETAEQLAKWFKEKLGEAINEVRVSKRLVGSPAVIIDADKFMTSSMRQMMKSLNKEGKQTEKQDLEINPSHPMIVQLEKIRQNAPELAAKVGEQIVDNARLAAGLLEDPKAMLSRLNELLQKVLEKGS